MSTPATKNSVNLLIVADSSTREYNVLKTLPQCVNVVATGKVLSDFNHLTEDDWKSIKVLLHCGFGQNSWNLEESKTLFRRLNKLAWMHTSTAGVEHVLFPELIESPVLVTNAKGVFSSSLAEWVIASCHWFAKELSRLRKNQNEKRWEPFFVEELKGKTMGIIGYGDIGRATAQLAKAFRMRVLGLRRRIELTEAEKLEGLVDQMFPPEKICELIADCDYVVLATPLTPSTLGIMSADAIASMKSSAIFINIGRGKCVDEKALVAALQSKRIRGAALDVFAVEPLPQDSPLWDMEHVLMSPHCADRTWDFQVDSMRLFVENMHCFVNDHELKNIVDKRNGY